MAARRRPKSPPEVGRSLAGRSARWGAARGGSAGGRGLAGILKAETRCSTIAVTALRASTSTTTRQSCAVTFSGLCAPIILKLRKYNLVCLYL